MPANRAAIVSHPEVEILLTMRSPYITLLIESPRPHDGLGWEGWFFALSPNPKITDATLKSKLSALLYRVVVLRQDSLNARILQPV
jgi:hypothetical protein